MTAPRGVRLLVVDDHAIVLAGLRTLLDDEPDLEMVGQAQTGRDAVEAAARLQPDIVLMDVRLGGEEDMSGIEACREIKSARPETRVIMFTSYTERESVLSSILAGASGFITKNVSQSRLIEAIRAVSRGESLLDPSVTREVMERFTELSTSPPRSEGGLSQREKEVLLLVSQGLTNKEIAEKLYLSPYTARNHVIRIMEKLGLSRRSQAAAEAVRLGLVRRNERE